MKEFIAKCSSHLLGVLSGFDRVLIRGSLRGICYPEGMMRYLSATSILLKDFGRHVEAVSERLKAASQARAAQLGRKVLYLRGMLIVGIHCFRPAALHGTPVEEGVQRFMPAPGAALDNLSRDMRVGCGRPHLARNAAKTAYYGNRILQKIPSSHLRFPPSRSRMLPGWWRSFKMSHYPTLFGWTHRSELCYITPAGRVKRSTTHNCDTTAGPSLAIR